MATTLQELFQFEVHLDTLFKIRLTAAGVTTYTPQDTDDELTLPRVQVTSVSGEAQVGPFKVGATTGNNYHTIYEFAVRCRVITQRGDKATFRSYLGKVREVMQKTWRVEVGDSAELALIEPCRQLNTGLEIDDGDHKDYDIAEPTFAGTFRIRDSAFPSSA